jgi:hypothetical protein
MTGSQRAKTVFRGVRNVILLAILSALPVPTQSQASLPARQASEYDVKAAFLLNFIKFIEWPPRPAEPAKAPFTICILGEDPFGEALDQIVAGESVNGQSLAVQRVEQALPVCRVLYVGEFDRNTAKVIAAAGHGVLTVGEGEPFVRAGGMIGFVVVNRRVRFDINHHAAVQRSLQVSSRLLSVARAVVK